MLTEVKTIWLLILGSITGIISLFGWSHTSLRAKMDTLSTQVNERPSFTQTKIIVDEKMKLVNSQIYDLRAQHAKMDTKLDRLLEICIKLQSDKG